MKFLRSDFMKISPEHKDANVVVAAIVVAVVVDDNDDDDDNDGDDDVNEIGRRFIGNYLN